MNQISLFDAQVSGPHNGQPTSVAAAVAAAPRITPQKRRILSYFEFPYPERHGMTQDECSEALNLPRSTACARFRELELEGYITKTNRTRPTRYGREAVVYELRIHAGEGEGSPESGQL